jgi:Ca2+-binding EF-hand superfamily protein
MAATPGSANADETNIRGKVGASKSLPVDPAETLSEEARQELREVYEVFKDECQTHVDVDMIGTMMRALGTNPSRDEVKGFLEDSDISGTMSLEQWFSLTAKQMKADEEDNDLELQMAFEALANGREKINLSEIHGAMANLCANLKGKFDDDSPTPPPVDKMVDLTEFLQLFR